MSMLKPIRIMMNVRFMLITSVVSLLSRLFQSRVQNSKLND
jgi:hypothetical protein